MTSGILVFRSRTEPTPPAAEALSLNRGTTREIPKAGEYPFNLTVSFHISLQDTNIYRFPSPTPLPFRYTPVQNKCQILLRLYAHYLWFFPGVCW